MANNKARLRRVDRMLAFGLWTFIGLLAGAGIGIFTGFGWFFLITGLVIGLLVAWRRDRAMVLAWRIEDDT